MKKTQTKTNDSLIENNDRRDKGAFYTPKPFADLAHKYISDTFGEDWKERFVVWDCACGEAALTKDYQFKELYCSTLEQSNIETMNELNYNMEANKFQYDFLNDSDEKLPITLQNAINGGKEILFLINPPYAGAGNMMSKTNQTKTGITDTEIGLKIKKEKWGGASKNLYAQFLFRIAKYQETNKNIKLCIFCPPLFLSGGSYKTFRSNFFNLFGYETGFLFEASNFSDVAKGWGISFTIFGATNDKPKDSFNMKLIHNIENEFKNIYNTDNSKSCSEWVREETKGFKNNILFPHLSNPLTVSQKDNQKINAKSIGSVCFLSNSVYKNNIGVSLFSTIQTQGNANISISIISENFYKVTSLFTARKTIQPNWMNGTDEYLTPNKETFGITNEFKNIYNTDNSKSCNDWVKENLKGLKTYDAPQLSSALNVKNGTGRGVVDMIGSLRNESNNVYENTKGFSIFSSLHSHGGTPFTKNNFDKAVCLFTARKTIQPTWVNCKDEYLVPKERISIYDQFSYDSIVYSLFNNSSQQSSLRQIDYKGKKWDIKNEFFWLSKKEMLDLSEANNYDNLYKDARTSDERFVYKKLFQEGIYKKLSPDAKEVLDMATDLLRNSIDKRKEVSATNPEYHLDSWDCGYAQLKLVYKQHYKAEFKVFRDKYKELEDRLRPLVYALGFLK